MSGRELLRDKSTSPTRIVAGRRGTGPRSRTLSVVLLTLASLYIAYLIDGHLGAPHPALKLSAARAVAVLLLLTASIGLTTLYHVLLIQALHCGGRLVTTRLGLAYSLSQIVRYLPGKIAGVVFEVQFLNGEVASSTVALALLIQMAISYAWASTLTLAVLFSAGLGSWGLLLLLPPAIVVLWCCQRFAWTEQMLLALPLAGRYFKGETKKVSAGDASWLTLLMVTNWLPFFGAWIVLATPSHSLAEAITFGAAYLGASIFGTVLIVVPSGLVVREAAFVWLGARFGLPIPDLLVMGVTMRLVLTLADVVNVAVCWVLDTLHGRWATK